jgi:aspartate aminotransferase
MEISRLAREIKESPTLKLNATAAALREKGEAVIHLGGGEPKSKVPIDALIAGAAKLMTAEIRYVSTAGIAPLIKAIIQYTDENYQWKVAKENVLVSNGAKHSFYNLMMALVNPDDEVVIIAPYWVSYPEIIKMVYGVPVVVTPADGLFVPKMKEIIEKVTSKTKAIVVNSPNNPSGAVYPPELIRELVELCEKKGIYLVMDDIYHKLVFNHTQWEPSTKFTKGDVESSPIVILNGVSKAYAMTGFRIGWTIANKGLTSAMVNIQAQNISCPSVILQAATVGALTGVQNSVNSLKVYLQNNRDVMIKELKTIPGIKVTEPDGTFYCLPDFSAINPDSLALSKFFLEKALVVTVPGKEFGMEGHLRLSYCGTIQEVIEGVSRIRWAIDPNSPSEIFIGDHKVKRDWK